MPKRKKKQNKLRKYSKVLIVCFVSACIVYPLLTQARTQMNLRAEKELKIQKIDSYYAKRGMPLAGHGKTFVEVADKYELDWRLLPAIAVRESSGGKRLMNNNPFGWGSAKIPFQNFDEAIEEVGKNLSGNDPDTSKYYKDTDNYMKLYRYNGTVLHTYPEEVLYIMDMFEKNEILMAS